ncbi:MAG TPA: MFS transporter [Acetobacteraceae bacterium]|jgi:MFS transporter, SHS family, lactate transporter|nr:MFS transporter [Acetobacteraceae bacterium]
MSDTTRARNVVLATYLGWTLDAFDFFILIFVLHDVAESFGTSLTAMTLAITLTLAMRPVGAFVFGRLADHYGRRPILIANILCFAVLEFFSGLAPTLLTFMILRTLFGVAMGGEWGIGASLAMESIPPNWRGWVSGLLQSGYPSGYFLATIVFGICFPLVGWRGMFMIGGVVSLAVVYFVWRIEESPDWLARQAAPRASIGLVLKNNAGLAIWAVIMMMAFNFFSHGTQDLYPSAFLSVQHQFSHDTITTIALVYNAGAIVGGLAFGALSQHIGRRTAIVLASVLALPVIPLWAFSNSPVWLAVGAFLMQICVQGAWGVIPAHLNEISPPEIRATFPGFVYQLGNFLASFNATLQAAIGANMGHTYSWALASVAGCAAVCIALFVGFGVERREVRMHGAGADPVRRAGE